VVVVSGNAKIGTNSIPSGEGVCSKSNKSSKRGKRDKGVKKEIVPEDQ